MTYMKRVTGGIPVRSGFPDDGSSVGWRISYGEAGVYVSRKQMVAEMMAADPGFVRSVAIVPDDRYAARASTSGGHSLASNPWRRALFSDRLASKAALLRRGKTGTGLSLSPFVVQQCTPRREAQ
jgi:hypothetical protein